MSACVLITYRNCVLVLQMKMFYGDFHAKTTYKAIL